MLSNGKVRLGSEIGNMKLAMLQRFVEEHSLVVSKETIRDALGKSILMAWKHDQIATISETHCLSCGTSTSWFLFACLKYRNVSLEN